MAGLLAFGMALGLSPRWLAAQSPEQLKDDLAASAKRILASCDYAEYINRAAQLADALGSTAGLANAAKSLISHGVPTMDLLTAAATVATKSATDRQVKVERQGLIMQLEQACQTWAMARDTQRQLEITKQVAYGTVEQLTYIRHNLGLIVREKWNELRKDTDLEVEVAEAIQRRAAVVDPDSALGAAIDSTTTGALRAARQLGVFTDSLQDQLDELDKDLYVWSTKDTTIDGRLHANCPRESGLPPRRIPTPSEQAAMLVNPNTGATEANPNAVAAVPWDARRGWQCGPASPERAKQVTAAAEIVRLRLENAKVQGKAHEVQVMAASEMMAVEQERAVRTARLQSYRFITP